MISSKILLRIQFTLVALCYLALAVAIAALLFGGQRKLVFLLGIAGSVLGAASLAVGALVKRAISMESNPYYLLAQMAERARATPAPVRPLQITIRPTAATSTRYLITIRNASNNVYTDGSLDHSRLLHPGKYGLDDTHMPANIWSQPPVAFKALAAGAQVSFEIEGYNVPDKYDGPRDTTVNVAAACGESVAVSNVTARVTMDW